MINSHFCKTISLKRLTRLRIAFLTLSLLLFGARDIPPLPPSSFDLPPNLLRAGLEGTVEPELAAGLEGDAPPEKTIQKVWNLFPRFDDAPPPFSVFRDGRGTVYLDFLLGAVPPLLAGSSFQAALQEQKTDSVEAFPKELQELIRQHVEPVLQARMVVHKKEVDESQPPLSLAVSDAYHREQSAQVAGRAFRVKAEFSLPWGWESGGYSYALELSADGGRTWNREEGGYFLLTRGEGREEERGAADLKSQERFRKALLGLRHVERLERRRRPRARQAVADFLHGLAQWRNDPGVRAVFMAAEERDEFVGRLQRLALLSADPSGGPIRLVVPAVSKPERFPSAAVFGAGEADIEDPRLRVVTLGLNPVSETLVELGRTSEGSATATLSQHPGGFAAHLSRAARAAGSWVQVVALKGRASPRGSGVADLLMERDGLAVSSIPWDGSDRPSLVLRTESGDEFRLTARSPRLAPEHQQSVEGELQKAQIDVVDGVVEALEEATRANVVSDEAPFVLAVGGQVTEPLVYHVRLLIQEAREKKGRVYLSPSSEMSRQVLEQLLSAGPHGVRFRSQDLMQWLESEEAEGETGNLAEKVAGLARRLLQLPQYAGITEVLVAMPPTSEMERRVEVQVESEVVVSREGAWQAKVSIGPGEQEDSFYRTGEADVALANYLAKREEGDRQQADAKTLLPAAIERALKARLAYRRLKGRQAAGLAPMPTVEDLAKLGREIKVLEIPLQRQAGLEQRRWIEEAMASPGWATDGFATLPQVDGSAVTVAPVPLKNETSVLYLQSGLEQPRRLPEGVSLVPLSARLPEVLQTWRGRPSFAGVVIVFNEEVVGETAAAWLPVVIPMPAALRMTPAVSREVADDLKRLIGLFSEMARRSGKVLRIESVTFRQVGPVVYAIIRSA